jgi:ABC-type transport system involved in multi-copper enzyme maturation permease subunit
MVGSIIHSECVRASRRGTRWLVRTGFLGALVVVLSIHWTSLHIAPDGTAAAGEILRCLASFHRAFAVCQLLIGLLLGPVWAASSIIEDRSNGALSHLLGSPMRAFEFVIGKLVTVLVRLAEIYCVGLPITVMCVCMGVVGPFTLVAELILWIGLSCASVAIAFAIALWCRRVVDALILVYLLQGLWFGLPVFNVAATIMRAAAPIPELLLRPNAIRATYDLASQLPGSTWMTCAIPTVTMFVAALAASLASVALFRRASLWIDGGAATERSSLWLAAIRPASGARSVWDRPLLWREIRCRRSTIVGRLLVYLVLAVGVIVLGIIAHQWSESVQVVSAPGPRSNPPPVCAIAGAATFAYLGFFAFPFLAISGAGAFSDERNGRMVELLTLTDLRQTELVHAKWARLQMLAVVLCVPPMLLMGVSLFIGYLTWAGWLLAVGHCLASFAFAITFGMAIALSTQKTSHATATTIVAGLVGGFLIPFLAFLSVTSVPSPLQYTLATMSPPVQCFFLAMFDAEFRDMASPASTISRATMRGIALWWTLAYGLASCLLYRSMRGDQLKLRA